MKKMIMFVNGIPKFSLPFFFFFLITFLLFSFCSDLVFICTFVELILFDTNPFCLMLL